MKHDDGVLPGMERGSWGWTLVHYSPSYLLGLDQHANVDENVSKDDSATMVMTMWSLVKLEMMFACSKSFDHTQSLECAQRQSSGWSLDKRRF